MSARRVAVVAWVVSWATLSMMGAGIWALSYDDRSPVRIIGGWSLVAVGISVVMAAFAAAIYEDLKKG